MSLPNIKNNKYSPGPLPEICAARVELLARMNQAAEKRLVFLYAPAGSGKTVSTLLWIKNSGRRTAWIGLDAFDNSTAVFYRLFCTGILSVQPDNDRMMAVLQDPDFDSSPIEHTINILAEFMIDGNEYALVLDDCHNITNEEILKSLPYIYRRLPDSFVSFVLSRSIEPRKPADGVIASGQAEVIGSEDLTFRKEEIEEYLTSLGHDMTGEEAEATRAFTGGWAIAVTAVAQSAMPKAANGFGGYKLANYITDQIWNEWDESLRAFMLASAAIDEMPVELCARITGAADAEGLLESLRKQNIFVSGIEDGVFRYHHLFLDFLRAQPEYKQADKKRSWRMAAEYYSAQENYLLAQRYAYESGDIEAILTIAYMLVDDRRYSIDEYLNISREYIFSSNIEALREKYPVLYIQSTFVAFLAGEAAVFEKNVDKLKENLPIIFSDFLNFAETSLGMIALDYRTPLATQNDQTALLSTMVINDVEMRPASIGLQMPFLHRSFRDMHELTDEKIRAEVKNTYGKLFTYHYELVMHEVCAGLYLEQNRMIEALTEARAAISNLQNTTANEVRFAAYMHLAATYLAQAMTTELEGYIEDAGQFVNEKAKYLRPNFLAFTARVKLWNGDRDAAREWLENYFVVESRTLEPYRIYQYFTTARAYVVLGELGKAKELASRLRQLGKDFHRPQDAAEAGVLIAVVLWRSDKKKEAQDMLETVLSEMQPRLFIRLVADEGAAVLPILRKVLRKTKRADYQGGAPHPARLDHVYVNNVYIAAYAVSKQRKGIVSEPETKPVKLSAQQKMIVELLSQGYSNDAIMTKTGLTINTVRSYTKIAYGKLGVNSAVEAVERAQELGIIE
jgi:LuxR family maltose regulon positive regulatory protein